MAMFGSCASTSTSAIPGTPVMTPLSLAAAAIAAASPGRLKAWLTRSPFRKGSPGIQRTPSFFIVPAKEMGGPVGVEWLDRSPPAGGQQCKEADKWASLRAATKEHRHRRYFFHTPNPE